MLTQLSVNVEKVEGTKRKSIAGSVINICELKVYLLFYLCTSIFSQDESYMMNGNANAFVVLQHPR